MTGLELVFWGCLGVVGYVYVGYPIVLWVWSHFEGVKNQSIAGNDGSECGEACSPHSDQAGGNRNDPQSWPMVSLIIAAYKEEDVILSRLQNAVMQDYPADRLEILIGCDGDEDLTGELVQTFHDSRVRLLQFPVRRGKASVLNDAVNEARGSILVFSDANTMMAPQAVRRLVERLDDPEVGGVCGKLELVDPITGGNVDGLYWRYENFLKRTEAQLGMLLGANGAIYAIRRELYQPLVPGLINDDFVIGMRVHLQGAQLVYEDGAMAREESAGSIDDEFHRRTRIGAGGFQSLMWLRGLLHPRRGRVAFAFWSHKVLRWLCPLFLIGALVANVALAAEPFYLRALLIHEMFYLAAAAGLWFLSGSRWKPLVRLPAMFVGMNAALLVGMWRWCSRTQLATWKRTERSETQRKRSAAPDTQSPELVVAGEQETEDAVS